MPLATPARDAFYAAVIRRPGWLRCRSSFLFRYRSWLFVSSTFPGFVPLIVRGFVPLTVRGFVPLTVRDFVPLTVRDFVPLTFLASFR